jgi:SagB-type dehydrogenase family enzyme
MQLYHNQTDINYKKYFNQANFIDYRTQPRAYKKYPHFYQRFNLDDYEELKFIKNFGKITATKTYGKEKVELRANPSAGGLYPCEIYIQIRGVKEVVSGIYHYEALENNITLIHELSNDGVEFYFDDKSQKKFVFLISNAYFRSAWKYEKRAIRYLLLDTGHQIGSIISALKLEDLEYEIDFNFDKKALNEEFSFDNFESFYTSITIKSAKTIEPKKLRSPIVNVCACDYQLKDSFIEEFYENCQKDNFNKIPNLNLFENISNEKLEDAINNRRSIRAFKNESITEDDFLFITKDIFEFASSFEIDIYFINNNIQGMQKGLYKNVDLIKEGDFKEKATLLGLNQKLAGQSAFTLFFTSKESANYFYTYILTGLIAQILYLKTTSLNLSCSGIGAYFDDECQEFLETKNNIFYLFAIGK